MRARDLTALAVFVQHGLGAGIEVVLRKGWVVLPFAVQEAAYLTLVLLQQADGVVFRVTLKENQAEEVLGDGHMHVTCVRLHQHFESSGIELLAADLVEARVGYVEAGVGAGHQRVATLDHPVLVHTPAFRRQRVAPLAVAKFQHGVGGKAGTQRGGDLARGPVNHLDERLPEGLRTEFGPGDIRSGDDEGVQPGRAQLIEALVVALHMGAALGRARDAVERERVDIELRDLIALTHQTEELPLGGLERGIRHHVEQADVHLADVLPQGVVVGEHGRPFAAQAIEGGQRTVRDQRHRQAAWRLLRAMARAMSSMKSVSPVTCATSSLDTV